MAARAPLRTLMGTWTDFGTWQRVYETAEAIEVDESNGMTGTRHRVFYDEVLLVTYHTYVGWPLALLVAAAAAFLGLVALAAALGGDGRTAVTITFFALLAAAFSVVRLAVKVDAVTIFGRRSRARASFWLNKDRARAAYLRVCARVRRAQERAAARTAVPLTSTAPINTAAGDKPPMNTAAGDKPPFNTAAGDKPPFNTAAGDKPPINTAGDKPPMNTAGDKEVAS